MALTNPNVPVWTIGDRLEKARSSAGLSQQEMADLLSHVLPRPIKKQTVSNWEQDVNQPRNFQAVLRGWAEITNVPMEWLLGLGGPNSACITADDRGSVPVAA